MEKIGRYQVLEEIGRGAMGVVYRAQDPAIGRVIAIKTIRFSDLTDESERERLRDRLVREAQSAGVLSHPNIVTIYDIAEENGMAFIFMEYVNGPPLEKVLSDGVPENDMVLNILRQTASALDYAHKKGIVHRDIKPANVMIHDDGQAKITDFGVAKIASQQMTQSGAMMGTPNYMPPEQVQGQAVDGRSDQFSLGVIAYEILTGEKPFAGDNLPNLFYKIVREDPAPPQRLNPTLGPKVETVLRKALAKAPEDRYLTCAQFVHELASALAVSKGWRPLPRGASYNLPTIVGAAPAALGRNGKPGIQEPVEVPPGTRPVDESDRNPLLRSLVWVLVGIGLIGLALLGAQKFLFNSGEERPVAETKAPDIKPADIKPADTKPADTKPPATVTPARSPTPRTPARPAPEKRSPAGPQEAARSSPVREQPARQRPTVPAERANTSPPVQPADHMVQFVTDPPGATLTVDNNSGLSCRTPCLLAMPSGRHVITAQLEHYRNYPRIVNVPQDSDVFMKLTKTMGSLSITSNPPGATILLDGQQQTQTTPAVFHVQPGAHHVHVARNGVPLDFDVEVPDGALINKNVNFQ